MHTTHDDGPTGSSIGPGGRAPEPAEATRRLDQLLESLRTTRRTLERYQQSHRALVEEVRRVRGETRAWQERALRLEQSAVFRVIGRYRRLVEQWAPAGTVRRRAYGRAVAQVRMLVRRPGGSAPSPTVAGVPTLPMALEPTVTIVIPVHNHWDLTAGCLTSIAEDFAAVGFEVVVVDDASTDATAQRVVPRRGRRRRALRDQPGLHRRRQRRDRAGPGALRRPAQQRHDLCTGLARRPGDHGRSRTPPSASWGPSWCTPTAGCKRPVGSSGGTPRATTSAGTRIRMTPGSTSSATWTTARGPACSFAESS